MTMGLNTGVSGAGAVGRFQSVVLCLQRPQRYQPHFVSVPSMLATPPLVTTRSLPQITPLVICSFRVAPTTSLLASLTMISSLLVLAALPSQVTPSDSAADPLTGLIPSFYVRLFLPLTPPLRGGFFMVISLTYPLLDCFCGFSSIYLDTDWMRPKCSFKYRLSN